MDETQKYDILTNKGLVRTDMHCHNCSKAFVAEIDYDIDGEHVIVCPYCGHEHFRRIENGTISDSRWSSSNGRRPDATPARVWTSDVLKMKTSTASSFIRDRWLNFGLGRDEHE